MGGGQVGQHKGCAEVMVYSFTMKHRLFISLLAVACSLLQVQPSMAQTAPGKYWVRFTDKSNSSFTLSHPEEFLSLKCIERRERQSLGFDELDLPVNQTYIDQVLAMGPGLLHHRSKWFNAITIATEDSIWLENVRLLPFVAEVRRCPQNTVNGGGFHTKFSREENDAPAEKMLFVCDSFPLYGLAWRQTEMLNVQWLHSLGYMGDGVDIAQFDAGWSRTDQLPAFERLRGDGRIKMTRDFVFPDNANVYTYNSHGTSVLSIMAAWLPGELVGAAPEANYYLFRTEDPFSEFPVETDNWAVAAELCDSLGIDIINSSLGYSLFDDPVYDHSYADMNGATVHCSIAAAIAARKGILVVNSAGNSGDDAWRYLTAPSDADGILAVGAVGPQEQHAWFSSYGPSADGRVKPDVVAMGNATAYAAQDSTIRTGNGTSFSSPLIAAASACLYQSAPHVSSVFLRDAILRSSSTFGIPTDSLGRGIPDYFNAWKIVQGDVPVVGDFGAWAYPNPCSRSLQVTLDDAKLCGVQYSIFDAMGRRCFESAGLIVTDGRGTFSLDEAVASLPTGRYTLHIYWELRNSFVSFTKINTP